TGAGKSSLVRALLGLHPVSGAIWIDGQPLDPARTERLRQETAWVDPATHLFNRSLLDNLCYGEGPEAARRASDAARAMDLQPVLDRLPQGLQTPLGEGGGLLSGGEGQRVRLGRAALKSAARLVLLDEPFRGLERPRRRELLARARERWRSATLLCVTHDVGDTLSFDR